MTDCMLRQNKTKFPILVSKETNAGIEALQDVLTWLKCFTKPMTLSQGKWHLWEYVFECWNEIPTQGLEKYDVICIIESMQHNGTIMSQFSKKPFCLWCNFFRTCVNRLFEVICRFHILNNMSITSVTLCLILSQSTNRDSFVLGNGSK